MDQALPSPRAQQLRQWFESSLRSIDPARAVRQHLRADTHGVAVSGRLYSADEFDRVRLIAFGKAALPMATAARSVLVAGPLKIATDLTVSPADGMGLLADSPPATKPLWLPGSHPYPDENSVQAADQILTCLQELRSRDLVLFLISGGGSAMVEKPVLPQIPWQDVRTLHQQLVTCGASIVEANIVRRTLSAIKGGRLAAACSPAYSATLLVSDVPDGEPAAVASGPTLLAESTVADAIEVITRWNLLTDLPTSIRSALDSGMLPELPAVPPERHQCETILDNKVAREALAQQAQPMIDVIVDAHREEELTVTAAADQLLAKLRGLKRDHPHQTVGVIAGGELSSPVLGSGRGGRNQAFALQCAGQIVGEPITVLSAGTDGIDGNSPAAGAIVDGETWQRGQALGREGNDFLAASDSHEFLAGLGLCIYTGSTETNVRDLRMLIHE